MPTECTHYQVQRTWHIDEVGTNISYTIKREKFLFSPVVVIMEVTMPKEEKLSWDLHIHMEPGISSLIYEHISWVEVEEEGFSN